MDTEQDVRWLMGVHQWGLLLGLPVMALWLNYRNQPRTRIFARYTT